jgi:hypothetical protein
MPAPLTKSYASTVLRGERERKEILRAVPFWLAPLLKPFLDALIAKILELLYPNDRT